MILRTIPSIWYSCDVPPNRFGGAAERFLLSVAIDFTGSLDWLLLILWILFCSIVVANWRARSKRVNYRKILLNGGKKPMNGKTGIQFIY
jgi:hypothetical protein